MSRAAPAGLDVSQGGEGHGPVSGIPAADAASPYVFVAATLMIATTALCVILMEEQPLAGPAKQQLVDMAEQGTYPKSGKRRCAMRCARGSRSAPFRIMLTASQSLCARAAGRGSRDCALSPLGRGLLAASTKMDG